MAEHDQCRQAVLDLLGVRYLVLPADERWSGGRQEHIPAALTRVDNVRVWENPSAMPRAWLVHQVEFREQDDSSDPRTTERRVREVLFAQQTPRDLGHSAVVDAMEREGFSSRAETANESCRVRGEQARRIDVEAQLTCPGLLVLSNQYDPGWTVEVTSDGTRANHEIVRANGVMQGVFLPAGTHKLLFQYAPRGFHTAASVSILGWLLCLAAERQAVDEKKWSDRSVPSVGLAGGDSTAAMSRQKAAA